MFKLSHDLLYGIANNKLYAYNRDFIYEEKFNFTTSKTSGSAPKVEETSFDPI